MNGAAMARPVPIDPRHLRPRKRDGSYPFVQHRTCADWSPTEGAR